MRHPYFEYYKRLARLSKDTQGTIFLSFILSIDNSSNIKWYVDALFVVNKDTRSYNGGFVSMVTLNPAITFRYKELNWIRTC